MRWTVLKTIADLFLEIVIYRRGFIKAVQFVLDSTIFIFDSVIYRQNYGSPMGFSLSPNSADLVM